MEKSLFYKPTKAISWWLWSHTFEQRQLICFLGWSANAMLIQHTKYYLPSPRLQRSKKRGIFLPFLLPFSTVIILYWLGTIATLAKSLCCTGVAKPQEEYLASQNVGRERFNALWTELPLACRDLWSTCKASDSLYPQSWWNLVKSQGKKERSWLPFLQGHIKQLDNSIDN